MMSTATNGMTNSTSRVFDGDSKRQRSRGETDRRLVGRRAGISTAVAWCVAIPAAIALCISGYLAYAALTMSEVAGCSGTSIFDCSHVLHSKWSKVFGIPVSFFALGTYLIVIAGVFATQWRRLASRSRMIASGCVYTAAIAAALAAVWFIYLQVFVLEHLCPWCMAAHACGLAIAAIAFWNFPISNPVQTRLATLAVCGLSGLITVQTMSAEKPTYVIETYPVEAAATDSSGQQHDAETDSGILFLPPGEDSAVDHQPPSAHDQDLNLYAAPVDSDQASAHQSSQPAVGPIAGRCWSSLLTLIAGPTSNAMLLVQTGTANSQPANSQAANSQAAGSQTSQPTQPRIVKISGSKGVIPLNTRQWPCAGDCDAKYIFVEMFDYTCEHCRATNAALRTAKQTLGKDLAVITLAIPLNSACNKTISKDMPEHAESCELAKLAVAVWRVDAKKFIDFHDWMFIGEKSPNYQTALSHAHQLVGAEQLDAELAKNVCSQYVAKNVELYNLVGAGPVPKMLFERTAIVGKFTSGDELVKLIKSYTNTSPNSP